MRKYFDDSGNPTTAANATSSKGGQGCLGQGCLLVFLVIALIVCISGVITAVHGG